MPKTFRLLLAAGGTGGHLFPGVAVAEAAQREVDAAVLFVGTQSGMEKEVIPRFGFTLRFIPAEQFRGRNWWGQLRAVWIAGYGIGAAWRVVREFAPDVIFSIGGYASGPTVLAGWLQRVPCVLLEPNAIPGLANRFLSWFAARVCVGFEAAVRFFPTDKVVYTGNPVRLALRAAQPAQSTGIDGKPFTILVFGGSAGAHRLNQIVPQALSLVHTDQMKQLPFQIIHQTGRADYEMVKAQYMGTRIRARVLPFIDAMQDVYAQADLVICRAGAMTTAELTLLGKPAILIPYPYAADDHQRANAEALVQAGAARMVLDHALTPELLGQEVLGLLREREKLVAMAHAAAALGRPDATATVVQTCVASASASRTADGEVSCKTK